MECFLIFIFNCSLLVDRNTVDFRILILQFCKFVELVYSNSCVYVRSCLGISIYKMMLSMNRGGFTSSLSVWLTFIYFSLLMALTKTSSKMSNRSREIGHPCFVPNFRRKTFAVSIKNLLTPGFLVGALCQVEKVPLLLLVCQMFLS